MNSLEMGHTSEAGPDYQSLTRQWKQINKPKPTIFVLFCFVFSTAFPISLLLRLFCFLTFTGFCFFLFVSLAPIITFICLILSYHHRLAHSTNQTARCEKPTSKPKTLESFLLVSSYLESF